MWLFVGPDGFAVGEFGFYEFADRAAEMQYRTQCKIGLKCIKLPMLATRNVVRQIAVWFPKPSIWMVWGCFILDKFVKG